jgi:hypothetical protein
MAIQGELWTSLEQININNVRKWLYGTVLVRDWDPAGTTTLANFTPFNPDGSLITSLFSPTNPGGPWFDVGAIDVNGVDLTPRLRTAETTIWQERFPSRTDIDSDGEDIDITMAETNPVALALYNNQPLVGVPGTGATSVLGSVGQSQFSETYSLFPQTIFRQMLIIGVDGELVNPIYICEIRPRVSLMKLNKRMFNAKTPDHFGVTFSIYPDTGSGFVKRVTYGGPAWLQLGGPVVLAAPDYVSQTPPLLSTATIVPSTLTEVPSGTGGTFTAGTYFWVITATTAAGESIRSNEVTATLSGSTSSNALSWTQVQGATGYKVYRGTSAGGESALITTIGSGSTVTYTDTGTAGSAGTPPVVNNAFITAPSGLGVTPSASGGTLPTSTAYWKITALTAAGESTVSNEVTANLTGPTASAALTWSADAGATGYNIYRGSASQGENVLAGFVVGGATTSFTDIGASVDATALASHQALLQFQQPASPNQPFTYVVQQTTGGSTVNATVVSGPTLNLATNTVQITVGSLTAANVYTFTVIATAGDGQKATYPVSNAITST